MEEFRFALFHFEVKINKVKRSEAKNLKRKIWSEKFEAKRSEKKRKKRNEILLWNSETHVKQIQFHFISLISEKFF